MADSISYLIALWTCRRLSLRAGDLDLLTLQTIPLPNKRPSPLTSTVKEQASQIQKVTAHLVNAYNRNRLKYWEIIADNLHKAGWTFGWVSALDLAGRTIWIVDAHGYGRVSSCELKKF